MRTLKGLGALTIALIGLNSPAQANLVIKFVSVAAEGSDFRYTYRINVGSNGTVRANDFVTLFDVNGYVAGSITPTTVLPDGSIPTNNPDTTGFKVTVQNTGITPTGFGAVVNEATTVPNITFVKNAPTIVGPTGPYFFSFLSTIGVVGDLVTFAGQSIDTPTDELARNIGSTKGPAAVPEPSVAAMVSVIGLMGLGYTRIHRGRKAA